MMSTARKDALKPGGTASLSGKRRFLFLDDEGWRQEKREIFAFLKGKIDFGIATHSELVFQSLRDDFTVTKLPVFPLRRGILYTFLMFFARELDTNLVRIPKAVKQHSLPRSLKILHRLRDLAGKLRLRMYRYTTALDVLYRRSGRYARELEGYDTLVYCPVSVQDKRVLFEARRRGMTIVSWVYSWDNPMKDNEFLANANRYLVWNNENRKDLTVYHGIPPERIDVVGPVQFDHLIELRERRRAAGPPEDGGYVLYACALGLDCYLDQEVNVIINLRRVLDRIDPAVRLLVRPYPFRKDKGFTYDALRGMDGIELLEFGTLEENQVVITRSDLDEKFAQIDAAECLVHLGSTIGLEASYTDTPIVQLAFNFQYETPDCLNLEKILEFEHLSYMLHHDFPNIVADEQQLEQVLRDILGGSGESYLQYSKHLRKFADPLGVPSYKQVFLEKLRSL
jgi:hypothetical protein